MFTSYFSFAAVRSSTARRFPRPTAWLAVPATLAIPTATLAQAYHLVDLGTLGGPPGAMANAINKSGRITGWAYDEAEFGAHSHAFRTGPYSPIMSLDDLGRT